MRLYLTSRGKDFFLEGPMKAGGHWPLAYWDFPDFLILGLVQKLPGISKEEVIEAAKELGEGKFGVEEII